MRWYLTRFFLSLYWLNFLLILLLVSWPHRYILWIKRIGIQGPSINCKQGRVCLFRIKALLTIFIFDESGRSRILFIGWFIEFWATSTFLRHEAPYRSRIFWQFHLFCLYVRVYLINKYLSLLSLWLFTFKRIFLSIWILFLRGVSLLVWKYFLGTLKEDITRINQVISILNDCVLCSNYCFFSFLNKLLIPKSYSVR